MSMECSQKEERTYTLFDEYIYLMSKNDLDSCQQDRLAEILDESTVNSSLDELITRFEIMLLSPEDKQCLLDEQSKMSEHISIIEDSSSLSSKLVNHF